MMTIDEFRNESYDYHRKYYGYIFDEWKWYSYRKFKANLYMSVAPYVAYFSMRLNITPNFITILYALMGLIGGVFLAIPSKSIILIGIIFFYFRSILDWSDGLLARVTNQTSITGSILDPYGAQVGWIALWSGLGVYVANKSIGGIVYFSPDLASATSAIFSNIIYLIPVIPAIFAMNIMMFARSELFNSHISKETQQNLCDKIEKGDFRSKNARYGIEQEHKTITGVVRSINQLFEHNTRTVDTICILILLELLFPVFITWIVFLAFLLWQIVIFAGTFYMVAKGGWAEKELQDKFE